MSPLSRFTRSSELMEDKTLSSERRKRIVRRGWFVPAIVVIVLVALVFWISAWGRGNVPDPRKWQAVFLNNGQVYFGHLQKAGEDYVEITNVYYLRAGQALQPSTSSTLSPSFELVKLGGELQGPEDAMQLEKSSILFWENMASSSQVVRAINNFQGNPK